MAIKMPGRRRSTGLDTRNGSAAPRFRTPLSLCYKLFSAHNNEKILTIIIYELLVFPNYDFLLKIGRRGNDAVGFLLGFFARRWRRRGVVVALLLAVGSKEIVHPLGFFVRQNTVVDTPGGRTKRNDKTFQQRQYQEQHHCELTIIIVLFRCHTSDWFFCFMGTTVEWMEVSLAECGHHAAAGVFRNVPFLGHRAMGPLPEKRFVKHPVPKSRCGRGKLLPGLEKILRLVVLYLLVRHGGDGCWWGTVEWTEAARMESLLHAPLPQFFRFWSISVDLGYHSKEWIIASSTNCFDQGQQRQGSLSSLDQHDLCRSASNNNTHYDRWGVYVYIYIYMVVRSGETKVLNVAEKPSVARALAAVFGTMPGARDRGMRREVHQIFTHEAVQFVHVNAQGDGRTMHGPSE
jgi:hypothetical protein